MFSQIALWPDPAVAEDAAEDTFVHERSLFRQGYEVVAGTDEVGRGPLAGPVVAACVILPRDCDYSRYRDSKRLTAKAREEIAAELAASGALIGVAEVEAAEIDRLNIHHASLQAMKLAIGRLPVMPDVLLVDGRFNIPLSICQLALVKGDSRSASIAAASIIAKVRRDEIMDGYHARFPQYNFHRNKGYPTAEHLRLITRHGICEIHRRSFRPVRETADHAGR